MGRTAIVGASLGGWLAADYATRRPQRAERLALMCPVGFGRLKTGAPLAALTLMPFGRRGRRTAIGLMLAPLPPSTPQEQEYAEFMILVSRHSRPRRSAPMFDDATIQRLDMPTLVFVGGRDRLIDSHETHRRLARLVPNAMPPGVVAERSRNTLGITFIVATGLGKTLSFGHGYPDGRGQAPGGGMPPRDPVADARSNLRQASPQDIATVSARLAAGGRPLADPPL